MGCRWIWLFLNFCCVTSCTSIEPNPQAVELGQPKASRGVVYQRDSDQEVAKLAAELEAVSKGRPSHDSAAPSIGAPIIARATEAALAGADPSSSTSVRSGAPAAGAVAAAGQSPVAPTGSARLLSLPKLSETEMRELFAGLRLRFAVDFGFEEVAGESGGQLPAAPEGIRMLTEFRPRSPAAGRERILRCGVIRFLSRPSQFWIEGIARQEGGGWSSDPDLATVAGAVESVIAVSAQPKPDLTRDDLEYRLVQISYIDIDGAMEGLKGFGVEVVDNPSKVQMPVPFAKLPVVARMPSPDPAEMALLGADAQKGGVAFDLSMTPSMATTLPPDPNLARASQMLVYYHPAHPEQFTRVRRLLDEFIDRPAQQIFIEGLVLEISEAGLKELGVDWQYKNGGVEVTAGNLFPGLPIASGTSGFSFDSLKDLEQQLVVKLRALIEEEKAEILSRPSVLTLNNRQATIRVGQEIPIATSSEAGIVKEANRISFNFKYLPTGISLNIRPRITEDGNEVSMLVDTVVSAPIPGADLELRSSSGEILASAPTVATRRVQTYTRIGNNTPFIIGGLVNKELTTVKRKVPLLGDIPYLGTLFRSKSNKSRKQEVIIVLTPHVLPEALSERAWGRYLPRDDDKFDDVGNTLFRAAYRIREEDVFDLSFLDRNPRLIEYRALAQRVVDTNFRLAEQRPFQQFLDGHTPGEHILVERMMYEVVKRLSEQSPDWLNRRVAVDRLIFFSDQNAGGYDVQFLERVLAGFGDGTQPSSFFTAQTGKALSLTFRRGPDAVATGRLNRNPIPEISLVDCPDRKAWGELLWAGNQPDKDGTPRAMLLLQNNEDLVRLQRALLLREIINLNGGMARVNRKTFSLGQVLLVPDENPHETRLLDNRVAEYFFNTEHYYAATLREIEQAIGELDRVLERPEYRHLRAGKP
ncbi:MAG: type II secretion system protein GspD [Verrucomicrobiales bacterium]|nr:type II secretion system protein GspD [Verrucomicrobiales bacterium]